MQIPQDPWVWALGILAIAVAVVVALIMGGKVEVGLDPPSIKFRRKEGGKEKVSVLEGAEMKNVKAGDVTGLRRRERDDEADRRGVSEVDVARRLKVKDGEIGDITGVTVSGYKEKPEEGARSSRKNRARE